MAPTNQRSRSVPPFLKLSVVKNSRVTKSHNLLSPRSFLDQHPDRGPRGDGPNKIDDRAREIQPTEDDVGSTGPLRAPCDPGSSARSEPNPESPEFQSLYLQMTQSLVDIVNAAPAEPSVCAKIRPLLEAANGLGRLGVVRGVVPCEAPGCSAPCKHGMVGVLRPRREEQALCREIINRTARDLSKSKTGKPLSTAKVLAAYGRNEIDLGGQKATSSRKDEESACEECKRYGKVCLIVTIDRFWKRKQCVECTQLKKSCSIDRATLIGTGSLLDWYVPRLIDLFVVAHYLPRFAPPMMYRFRLDSQA